MAHDRMNKEDLEALAKSMGPLKAREMLESLGRSSQFLRAFESPVGKELLKDGQEQAVALAAKVHFGEPTIEERMLLRAYLTILNAWGERIDNHARRIAKVQRSTTPASG